MCVCVCVCGCDCYHDRTKTPDRNDLKLGTVVVLDSLSKPIDFGFKLRFSKVRVSGILVQKIILVLVQYQTAVSHRISSVLR